MGLDAKVYCDCYETGRITRPPPYPDFVVIDEDGAPVLDRQFVYFNDNMSTEDYDVMVERDLLHDQWLFSTETCAHESFSLLHHYIGNIATVAFLRGAIGKLAETSENKYLLIRDRIVYNGIHCGDRISIERVPELSLELDLLAAQDKCVLTEEQQKFLEYFIRQFRELVDAALSVNKPICF